MADIEKKIRITADGSQAISEADEVKDALKKTGDEAAKSQGYFQKKLQETKDKLNEVKSEANFLIKGFNTMSGALTKVGRTFGLSSKAATAFGKATSLAIAATGIGLLIPLVISLFNWFKNMEGGAKALRKVMDGLGSVISNAGKALKLIVQGKFGEAFRTIRDGVVEATKAVDAFYEASTKLHELQKENIITNATLKKTIEEEKKILEDTTLSLDKRLKSLDRLNKATKELNENQLREIELELQQKEALLANENNWEKRRDLEIEISSLKAKRIEQETTLGVIEYEAAKKGREIIQQVTDQKIKMEEEAAAKRKKIWEENYAEEVRIAKEKVDELNKAKFSEEQFDKEIEAFMDKENALSDIEIDNTINTGNEVLQIKEANEAEATRKALEAEQLRADRKKEIIQSSLDTLVTLDNAATQMAINNLKKRGLSEEEFDKEKQKIETRAAKRQKAYSVAQVIINTAESISKTLATGGPLAIPLVAVMAALGAAQLATILSTPVDGSGVGGGISTPSAPSTQPNTSFSFTPSTTTPTETPVGRTYVIGKEVRNQNELDRQVIGNGTI